MPRPLPPEVEVKMVPQTAGASALLSLVQLPTRSSASLRP